MSNDTRFLSDLLASDRTHTGQVTDSESSIIDSDCEALISSPSCKKSNSMFECQLVWPKNWIREPTSSNSDSVSQQVINMQILGHSGSEIR